MRPPKRAAEKMRAPSRTDLCPGGPTPVPSWSFPLRARAPSRRANSHRDGSPIYFSIHENSTSERRSVGVRTASSAWILPAAWCAAADTRLVYRGPWMDCTYIYICMYYVYVNMSPVRAVRSITVISTGVVYRCPSYFRCSQQL